MDVMLVQIQDDIVTTCSLMIHLAVYSQMSKTIKCEQKKQESCVIYNWLKMNEEYTRTKSVRIDHDCFDET